MSGSLWKEAKAAVQKLAPFACQADPDGITLYLFSSPMSQHPRYPNIKDPHEVERIFQKVSPGGTTDLTGVVRQAFEEHFSKYKTSSYGAPMLGTTILVITDGVPDNKDSLKKEIIATANKIRADEELSITFAQIGRDKDATKFLKVLDDDLQKQGAKYDIVDHLTVDEMDGMSFEQIINHSIDD
jgi:uncharacterized protein with von Willebrand factor type A (vWA) domain